ncbi:MAG: OmpA family protein [Flavobacteriales bacterium]
MKKTLALSILCSLILAACVPSKKYNELLEREKSCSEELAKYKKSSTDYEVLSKDLQSKYDLAAKEVSRLRGDTNQLGNQIRLMTREQATLEAQYETLENSFDKLKNLSAKETATLQTELEAKTRELQRKEDALLKLDEELKVKQALLIEREKRVNELEEAIRKKDAKIQLLKARVANALRNFENQGLTVVQKNGKIYVSLEAKLLFNSGSTKVEEEGKAALVELAKVLETERDLEIVVEGHTDTDKLTSSVSPKNNWELSVLRATAVVELMLANSKMIPAQIMAAGRSEYHPVDPTDKSKNRRIEIIISPNLNELFEIISNE